MPNRPPKRTITLRLDADVIAKLKSEGRGYQTRINAMLRETALRPELAQLAGEEYVDVEALFSTNHHQTSRYERRIAALRQEQGSSESVERTVNEAVSNLLNGKVRSFAIYGEPQSGKTEMMIALTAKLLDSGYRMIVVLLNDSVQLLNQNLSRFRQSGLDPAPRSFSEVLDHAIEVTDGEFVIFCKKNSSDLRKLIKKIGEVKNKVVIDDEADFATPDAKANKAEQTRINELVGKLIANDGTYIGVTATPARLNSNRTFENENEQWVEFKPHDLYKGRNFFFPREGISNVGYVLTLLPDTNDPKEHLTRALLGFFVNAAYLNQQVNQTEENYSILIHTSGKRADHSEDHKQVIEITNVLKSPSHVKFPRYMRLIWQMAKERFPGYEQKICLYINQNINRHAVIVMNGDFDKKNMDYATATLPATLFTIAIGGNIVSRGVTFNNLLSMFFNRDAKHIIQQDTYIQRARMFGRRDYDLRFFELTIPESLYVDWHRCFVFHRLALDSIRSNNGSPIWLQDSRITAASPASVDRARLDMDTGEMSFRIFELTGEVETVLNEFPGAFERLDKLATLLGEQSVPRFLVDYIREFSPYGEKSLAIHPSKEITNYTDADQEVISRRMGFIGQSDREESKYPHAVHHLKIFFNQQRKARLFYKHQGSITFLRMRTAA